MSLGKSFLISFFWQEVLGVEGKGGEDLINILGGYVINNIGFFFNLQHMYKILVVLVTTTFYPPEKKP